MQALYLLLLILGCVPAWGQNQNLQCPCVLKPGTTDCLIYDSRYQATSVDEAMATFHDMTIEDQHPADDSPIKSVKADDMTCTTTECTTCTEYLKSKLAKIGLIAKTGTAQLALDPTVNPCLKYRFSRNETGVYDYGSRPKKGKKKEDSGEDSNSSDEDNKKSRKRKRNWKNWFWRSKRQASQQNNGTVGERFNLSCTTKGISSDTGGLLSLCSKCWAWRKLPANYFPQFINEIICDSMDSDCLSGYATCGVGLRSMEVIKNDTGVPTTVTINGGSYCECRVASGSTLQGLVEGNGLSSSLPSKTPAKV
ncbi:hypothetical protein L596_022438 [Steinernema carpocapsae]|uniref:Uncharacterized protein n=1 Tax=Steinernema carpocapsae TaxID=34508 RepID=A0A4V6A079_STECR|nr:hypothetical protein L596_022438 [Steinernema carpocapsae]